MLIVFLSKFFAQCLHYICLATFRNAYRKAEEVGAEVAISMILRIVEFLVEGLSCTSSKFRIILVVCIVTKFLG